MPVDKALAFQTLIKGDTRGDTKDEAQAPALAWPAAGNNTRRFDRSAMVSTSSEGSITTPYAIGKLTVKAGIELRWQKPDSVPDLAKKIGSMGCCWSADEQIK